MDAARRVGIPRKPGPHPDRCICIYRIGFEPLTGSDMTTRTQPNEPQSSRNGEIARRSYAPLAAAAVLGVACHKAESYVRPPVPVRASTVRESPQVDQELSFS